MWNILNSQKKLFTNEIHFTCFLLNSVARDHLQLKRNLERIFDSEIWGIFRFIFNGRLSMVGWLSEDSSNKLSENADFSLKAL